MNDLEKYVDSFLSRVAREQDCSTADLLKKFAQEMAKEPKAKVAAIMGKPETTIDADTGNVRVTRQGVMKGFGKGFRDYVMKGNVSQQIGAEVKVGQFPEGHELAGKYAVQIMLQAFDKREYANDYADRVTPIIEGVLGTKAIVTQ